MTKMSIPEEELETDFKKAVYGTCQSLADVCYARIMKDPDTGMQYLSKLATILDCTLDIKIETTVPIEESAK
jgi:hypothetical protein